MVPRDYKGHKTRTINELGHVRPESLLPRTPPCPCEPPTKSSSLNTRRSIKTRAEQRRESISSYPATPLPLPLPSPLLLQHVDRRHQHLQGPHYPPPYPRPHQTRRRAGVVPGVPGVCPLPPHLRHPADGRHHQQPLG